MLSVEIIVFCEDFFGLTAQLIQGRPIIGYGNSTNFALSDHHSLWSPVPSALSALQSCKFIAAREDLFLTANQHELTRIKRARTPFKKQSYASRFKRTISHFCC